MPPRDHDPEPDIDQVMGMTAYPDTYLRQAGRWLCIQAQLTAVTPQHHPDASPVINTHIRGRLQACR